MAVKLHRCRFVWYRIAHPCWTVQKALDEQGIDYGVVPEPTYPRGRRKLVIEHTDVILRSTDFPRMKFNQFLLTPYFGPGLLPHAQTLWIDELAVGTKRLGPVKAK